MGDLWDSFGRASIGGILRSTSPVDAPLRAEFLEILNANKTSRFGFQFFGSHEEPKLLEQDRMSAITGFAAAGDSLPQEGNFPFTWMAEEEDED